MNRTAMYGVALLAAIAGQAMAQVDGKLLGETGLYGPIIWVQNQPTSFGDNTTANVPPSGNALTATQGMELRIPLAAIGGTGAFNLAGWITSGDHTFMSNQVIGGLPNIGNVGGAPNFTTIAGQQWIAVNATAAATAPTIDGTLDAAIYGGNQAGWAQNNYTGFGDSTNPIPTGGGGSEIDAVYAVTNGGFLYLMITGNTEANGNGLALFIDSVAGGQNVLSASNPAVANPSGSGPTNILNAMAGITFDGAFAADYFIDIAGRDTGGAVFAVSAAFADLNAATSAFSGSGGYANIGGALTGGAGGPAISMTVDNSNILGVTGSPPVTIPSRDDSVGSELNGAYGVIDEVNNDLRLLLTGNIQTNSNKVVLFFDVDGETTDEGQNPLRGDNMDISFNGLNRMGSTLTEPGVTFEADFFADYWVAYNTFSTAPVQHFADAAVLRTNGPLKAFGGGNLDYGCYSGGSKIAEFPIVFNGTTINPTNGTLANIYSEYAPRTAGAALLAAIAVNPEFPEPQNFIDPDPKLEATSDQSNVLGVTDLSAAGADLVTTGIEYRIDLDELGWDGVSDIKVSGWIANNGYDFVSNQVLGGLPAPDQLGEPRLINFQNITGTQYIIIQAPGGCPADLTTTAIPGSPGYGVPNGIVNNDDFFYYLSRYAANLGCVSCPTPPDLTTTAIPGSVGYGVPNGILNNDDFFYYLTIFAGSVGPC